MTRSQFGSHLLDVSHILICPACSAAVAYVITPGGELAAECQTCGKTVHADFIHTLQVRRDLPATVETGSASTALLDQFDATARRWRDEVRMALAATLNGNEARA